VKKKEYRSTPEAREVARNQQRKWRAENTKRFVDVTKRRPKDELAYMIAKMRSRLSTALKVADVEKTQQTVEYIGCTKNQLKVVRSLSPANTGPVEPSEKPTTWACFTMLRQSFDEIALSMTNPFRGGGNMVALISAILNRKT
jgi:hypothetical protein